MEKHKATTDGLPPHPEYSGIGSPAPQPIDPRTGQHKAYWVLSEEERAKGFVRPVRFSYKHVGVSPKYPLRDLTQEESDRYKDYNYSKFELYPDAETTGRVGRFWTEKELQAGCGGVTNMGTALAETYARDPSFYGATFCAICKLHLRVWEFVWVVDGLVTEELVGS